VQKFLVQFTRLNGFTRLINRYGARKMKQKLKAWFEQLLSGSAATEAERDINIELLFPLSQLYGMEYYPALHRYHEK
jgi:hypothetical protein